MKTWLVCVLTWWFRWLRWLVQHVTQPARSQWRNSARPTSCRRIFAHPKPKWVRNEVIWLKAIMPDAGCRTIAHHFNRRHAARRQMTVGKSYVAGTLKRHHYLIFEARRKLKHRVPRSIPRNRVWGCDLLVKADTKGQPHLALAILDHASRACLRLQRLSDKSSWTLLQELVQAVRRYGRPQFVRTDNEAVLVSRVFRFGLWLVGIRQQRSDPGCPWQNGRVERFIGTVKRRLATEPIAGSEHFTQALHEVRTWYNHDRPHDHIQGRTLGEVWAGIDVFATRLG